MSIVSSRQVRAGRGFEMALSLLALTIVFIGWTLTEVGISDSTNIHLPANFMPVAVGATLGTIAVSLIIRWRTPWADPLIFPIALLLNGLGLVMIHRIDFALIARGGSAEVGGQLMLSGLGIFLMVVTLFLVRDHRWLRRYSYLSLIAGVVLLLLPMVPGLGQTINGARLWIHVAGMSFQPAELAKIFLAIFFAGYLVAQRDNLALAGPKFLGMQFPRMRHFMPILVAWLACMALLALENDFGTVILFFGLFVAMLYVATERVSWLAIGGVLTAAGVILLVQAMPRIQARFDVWLNALDNDTYSAPFGSYQLVQGWFGMASGGLFGTGLGQGYPTLTFASNSDFIIASFGEELGLTGVLVILVLYLLLVMRAFNAGFHLRDGFGKLLASGLGFVVALQAFVVVGGVTRVIPLTGLALPLLALGGSSLLTNWIIVGLLLRMSNAARRPFSPSSAPLSSIDSGELPPSLREPSAPTPDDDTTSGDEPGSHNTEVVTL